MTHPGASSETAAITTRTYDVPEATELPGGYRSNTVPLIFGGGS